MAWGPGVAALVLAVAPAGVSIQPGDSVAGCPSSAQVQAALTGQRGGAPAPDGWIIRYVAVDPPFIAVEVIDPAGAVQAQRQVTRRTDRAGCASTAETIAAIAVRAFEPLAWAAGRGAPGTTPPASVAPSAPAESPTPRLVIAAGPALVSAPSVAATILLDVRARLGAAVHLHAGAFVWPLHASERVGVAGTARLTRLQMFAGPTWVRWRGPLSGEVGPAISLALDSARADAIAEPAAQGRRAVVAGGAAGGVALALGKAWNLGLFGGGLVTVAASDFKVTTDMRSAAALRPARFSGFLGLRVGYAFFW